MVERNPRPILFISPGALNPVEVHSREKRHKWIEIRPPGSFLQQVDAVKARVEPEKHSAWNLTVSAFQDLTPFRAKEFGTPPNTLSITLLFKYVPSI